MNTVKDSSLIIEMLETVIYGILYIRGAYPKTIFKAKKLYGTVVRKSIFPPLNEYMTNVLKSAVFLLKNKQLRKLEIIFCTETSVILETYLFDLTNFVEVTETTSSEHKNGNGNGNGNSKTNGGNNDCAEYQRLIDFEESVRRLLLRLDENCKNLRQLPLLFDFRLELHTTQTGLDKLNDNPKLESFPWVRSDNDYDDPVFKKQHQQQQNGNGEIVPMGKISGIDLIAQSY